MTTPTPPPHQQPYPTQSAPSVQPLPPHMQIPAQRQDSPGQPQAPKPKVSSGAKMALAALGGLIVGLLIGTAGSSNTATPSRVAASPGSPSTVYMTAPAAPAVTVTETPAPPPPPPGPRTTFSDGTYEIGPDIVPGKYKTPGSDGSSFRNSCYMEVSNGSGQVSGIVQNDNLTGPGVVTLPNGKYFKTSGGCTWTKVG